MSKEELNDTDKAREAIKKIMIDAGYSYYDKYIENKLAGDFAFHLMKAWNKRHNPIPESLVKFLAVSQFCPSDYGLDDDEKYCQSIEVAPMDYRDDCKKCWKQALRMEE